MELVPVPVVVIFPGDRVKVHTPAEGNPLSTTLPVATVQVGTVIVPIWGAVGIAGWGEITRLPEEGDTHPNEFVTVKVYVPGLRFETVVLVPEPVVVVPPGDRVRVHVPEAGRLFITALPVAIIHVGCVTVPITGADGEGIIGFITTEPEEGEVHPEELVTVNVKVPEGIPEITDDVPVPVVVIPPGDLVTVQVPLEGSPVNSTEPVVTPQAGWVIVPVPGAVGVTG